MTEKILLCAVPYVETEEPIMAPALLKSVLANEGFDATAIDLNIEIINQIKDHPKKQNILDFFFSQLIHEDVIPDIRKLIRYSAERIASYQPEVISLSLLIYSCQIFTRWLCAELRQLCPDARIVIGGTGIKNHIASGEADFYHQAKDLGLIDDYIVGDGDVSLIEYMKGNYSYPGINSDNWEKIPNMNELPIPDFSDYNFDLYDKKCIPINDSRGCVKNCEFCDVIEYWQKFQYRTAENMWEEMLEQIDRLGITFFSFRSSLINGNLKEFKKLLKLMQDYNRGKPKEKQISWEGYFIIRAPTHHKEELWQMMHDTNALLLVGVESVIYDVRKRMGKTFEDSDIDYHLEMGRKYNVKLILLMIVAYPTETLENYEYTKQWFRDHKEFANNSVAYVSLSYASVLPGTQLARRSDEYGIKRGKLPSIWFNHNLAISNEQKREYLLELYDICSNECGFNTSSNQQTLETLGDGAHQY